MKISIVTISFNQAQFLEQAIRSVIEQDYPDIEYIVVDPGSTDGSREIIHKYSGRIDKIILEPDLGPADGLNKGFAAATGDIFGFINADDGLLPGAIQQIRQAFISNPNADIISGHMYMVNENNQIIKRVRATPFSAKRFVYGGVQVVQQSTFFKADAFRKTNGFNILNRTSWDAELLLEMVLAGCPHTVIEKYLAFFRLHQNSITGSQTRKLESAENHRRYFQTVMGREAKKTDQILRHGYLLYKWLTDPKGLLIRVFDAAITRQKQISV